MTTIFKKTLKQEEATKLMASNQTHIMLLGGGRSGKTFITIRNVLVRASKVKSRHVILRQTFNSVKTSIFLDTLPKVLNLCFPDMPVKWNKSDYFVQLPNGSELWIGGLEDDKRVEKILGKEYSTIYFNEVTQLNYSSVQVALTRLAEKNTLRKKAYYDMNPSTKTSWSYLQFIKKLDPIDNGPLSDPDDYVWMRMNPKDNIQNIDENYLNLLSKMPEKDRLRFLEGEFQDESDGQVYYEFNRENHVKEFTEHFGTKFVLSDFNVDPHCSLVCQFVDGQIQVIDEWFLRNSDTPKAVHEWSKKYKGSTVIPDSTGKNRKTSGQSDFDIIKAAGFQIMSTHNPFVKDRVNNVNRCLKENKIIIHPRCKKLINDLERVSWKNNELDQKTDSLLTHISDALGYGCYNLLPQSKLNLKPFTGIR
jgi:PBSX family phage terminase large subunit